MFFAFRSLETKKKDLMALFAEITKDDVTLNNYISRSKVLVTPAWDRLVQCQSKAQSNRGISIYEG